MASLLNKSASIQGNPKPSKYTEIASWLEKTRNEDNTEHNINREHHNWTSEPELWLYQPGLEPRSRNRSKGLGVKRDFGNMAGRKNSIESPSTESDQENEEIAGESESTGFNPNSLLGRGTTNSSRKPFSMKSYGRKQYRRHKMKYGKKLQSSKSDSYHKKHIWDMVFNERAVVAIQQEYRQMQRSKLKSSAHTGSLKHSKSRRLKNGLRGYPSILSATSGDDCSQGSLTKFKMPRSAAAAASLVGDVDDLLLRSASQGIRDEMEKDKRKISQTGSALFAQFDLQSKQERRKIDKTGRHPAKSSSKEGSDLMKGQNGRTRSGVLKRGDSSSFNNHERTRVGPSMSIADQMTTAPQLSLENNYNSTGGTDSYNMSSGQMTNPGYPGYPTPNIPYMDPMMLQAFMMQGMYNPMMVNYNFAQQAQQQAQQASQAQGVYQKNSQVGSGMMTNMTNYPGMGSNSPGQLIYPNLSSSSGGYPNLQQDLINQLSAGMMQTIYQSNNKSNDGAANGVPTGSPNRPSLSLSINESGRNGSILPGVSATKDRERRITRDKESSEESEDIRPSRHAIDDRTNDLHPKKQHKKKDAKLYSKRKEQFNSSGFARTRTSNSIEGFTANIERFPVGDFPLEQIKERERVLGNTHIRKEKSSPIKQKAIKPSDDIAYSNSTSIVPKKERPIPRASVTDYLAQLKSCVEILKKSGWYWGNVSGENAMAMVEKQGLGSFLIRDSTHQKFLFTLTVHTSNGPTNVRIVYRQGLFGLDCDGVSQSGLKFNCVVKMIAHYVSNSKKYKRMANKKKAIKEKAEEEKARIKEKEKIKDDAEESNQITDLQTGEKLKKPPHEETESSIALLLLSPCRKACPTLKHLARLALNKKLARKSARNAGLSVETLITDVKLLAYCQKYPYTV